MIAISGENYEKCKAITSVIDGHLRQIANDTGHCATHREKHEHPSMQALVEMGDKIIPYLFHRLTQHGATWTIFILLRKITKQTPVSKEVEGKLVHTMIAWMQWYIDTEYYKNTDVYYGLIKE